MTKGAMETAVRILALAGLTIALAGCVGSARFGGSGPALPRSSPQPEVVYNAPEPDDAIVYAPGPADGAVIASPLPPPSGGLQGGASGVDPAFRPSLSDIVEPQGTGIADPLPDPGLQNRELASRGPTSPQTLGASPSPGTSRTSLVGGWTARDGTGASCRVQLSSTPALDLYRASASGCANRDLSAITAWDFRDGEVYLYQRGGAVAARLRQGGGGFSGVLTRSGATVSIAR